MIECRFSVFPRVIMETAVFPQDVKASSNDAQLTVAARPAIQITRVCVHVTVFRVGEQPLQHLDVVEHGETCVPLLAHRVGLFTTGTLLRPV
jgi:hypothetical protein